MDIILFSQESRGVDSLIIPEKIIRINWSHIRISGIRSKGYIETLNLIAIIDYTIIKTRE